MNQVLPLVLPLSLGAAVSPTLLTIVLLILAGKVDRKPRAWGFTLGVGVVRWGPSSSSPPCGRR